MTNGEKFKEVFKISQVDGWNAEYKEPSTKINQDFNQDLTKIAVEEFANKILNAMDFSIKVTDSKDAYGVEMRNGIRYCKSLIDNKEPEFENVPENNVGLGVERQIKEIFISYPKSNLKEHDGQPYYSVKYIENGEEYQGYGTYKIEVLMEYLRNYFMPSATPQLSSETRKNSQKLENVSTIIDWNNCHTSEQIDSITTTKNDLAVDCVSRGTILTLINDVKNANGFREYSNYEYLFDQVDTMPSVTPQEPRKGKWTKISNTVPCMNCPICGSTFTLIQGGNKMHYCPNCGAKMSEE